MLNKLPKGRIGLMGKVMECLTKNLSLEGKKPMIPMEASVYETSTGPGEIATWNMGMMADMFPGVTGEVLKESADNLAKTLKGIVE